MSVATTEIPQRQARFDAGAGGASGRGAAARTTDGELPQTEFTWLIASLCQLHQVPLDTARLLQDFPAPHTIATLQSALRASGFDSRNSTWQAAPATPCLAFFEKSVLPPCSFRANSARRGDSVGHIAASPSTSRARLRRADR